jgi:hypothetical protein
LLREQLQQPAGRWKHDVRTPPGPLRHARVSGNSGAIQYLREVYDVASFEFLRLVLVFQERFTGDFGRATALAWPGLPARE